MQMTYKKKWTEELKKLPYSLQRSCINYKVWKKKSNESNLTVLLRRECDKIDHIFVKNQTTRRICFASTYTKTELYNYAGINKTCLRKLIKRLDKRYSTKLNKWYNENKEYYKFCGSFELRKLRIDLFGDKEQRLEKDLVLSSR